MALAEFFYLKVDCVQCLDNFKSWTFMDFWQTLGKIDFSEFEKKNENLNQILKNWRKNMNGNGGFLEKKT